MKKRENWERADNLARLAGWRRQGLCDGEIAKRMGISRAALLRMAGENEEIAEALRIGRDAADFMVEGKIFEMATEGNLKAIELWLKHRMPQQWGGAKDAADAAKIGADIPRLADLINNPLP
ncbi:MAG: hypothetical protein FWB71_03895 [Defluviitaleaceae bacterium]|nr:hypothetical protein [Defluviitaleaceae bacterium]